MKRILIVDDNEEILDVISIILQGEGYEIHCCNTGHHLFENVIKFDPDLILLDIMLGEYDGRELCDEIKSNKKTLHIPIILISAAHDLQHHPGKADGFVAKPFELDYLIDSVAAFIN